MEEVVAFEYFLADVPQLGAGHTTIINVSVNVY